MPKILKPYTIIPPELYVQRDADRQLKNILSDMGRPGYVLVSRQMGKTNLLINAKRKHETPDDVFVYVDLSNSFEKPINCFENIIDIAIESNQDKFESVAKILHDRRAEIRGTPPHKQHINELRLLLNSIPGKLVIILDEIDALTKTHYSDQIFSQIRSIYFSRVNYKELERLTYILSGVIEPTEIIKDPKISPFNIGQKIFLNDFNRDEFEQFLVKANLHIEQNIRDRVFYWTNGNPRITWDICSEIENHLKIGALTIDLIDKIVNELYLTTFDKPPIDNIREIVRNDREIRNSIIEIEYKKGKVVSDRIKSKLYLSGIINYNESEIHIKNEIIRRSVNLDWIKSLEEEEKGLVRLAIEQFEKENFNETLIILEKYLLDNQFEESDKSLLYYYMGVASYRLSNYTKALYYLDQRQFSLEEDGKLYYMVQNLTGLIHFYCGRIDESLSCFKIVLQNNKKDELYLRALLNFGSICLRSNKEDYLNDAEKIFISIIEDSSYDTDKIKDTLLNELKTTAHYNLGLIQSVIKGDIINATINFKKSLTLGSDNIKPKIILSLFEITSSNEEKLELLNKLIDFLILQKIEPKEFDPDKPLDFSFDDIRSLAIVSFLDYRDTLFDRVVPLLKYLGHKELSEHIYELAIFSIKVKSNWEIAIKLLKVLYINFNDPEYKIKKEIKYRILKLIAYYLPSDENLGINKEYLLLFSHERTELVDHLDLVIFSNIIYTLIDLKEYQEALRYANIINSIKSSVPEDILIDYVVIYHLELNIYFLLKDRLNMIRKAKEIIQFTNDEKIKHQKSNLLGETGLDVIKQNAESILTPTLKPQKPIVSSKTFGRNEIVKVRYKDGTILVTKFKRVMNDLETGACYVLS